MAVVTSYTVEPVKGRVHKARQVETKTVNVHALPHNIDLLAEAVLSAFHKHIKNNDAWVVVYVNSMPPEERAFKAQILCGEDETVLANLFIREIVKETNE
jgi:hypothetical protein